MIALAVFLNSTLPTSWENFLTREKSGIRNPDRNAWAYTECMERVFSKSFVVVSFFSFSGVGRALVRHNETCFSPFRTYDDPTPNHKKIRRSPIRSLFHLLFGSPVPSIHCCATSVEITNMPIAFVLVAGVRTLCPRLID